MTTARLVLLAASLAAALAGCSRTLTVAEIRDESFQNYRPLQIPRKIDAFVAVETTASRSFSTMDETYVEAMRQLLAEDLATLFTRPALRPGGQEEFVLKAAMAHRDAWFSRVVEVTATLLDPKTGKTIASYQRGGEVSAGRA